MKTIYATYKTLPGTQHRKISWNPLKRASRKKVLLTFSLEPLSLANFIVDEPWMTKTQTGTCAARASVQIQLPVVVVVASLRRHILSSLFSSTSENLKNSSPDQKSRCRTCAQACYRPFNSTLVPSVFIPFDQRSGTKDPGKIRFEVRKCVVMEPTMSGQQKSIVYEFNM